MCQNLTALLGVALLTICSCDRNHRNLGRKSGAGRHVLATLSSVERDTKISQQLFLLESGRVRFNRNKGLRGYLLMKHRFFASAGCAWAQICVNVILNSTAVAMDLQAWAPKWLNIRRGYRRSQSQSVVARLTYRAQSVHNRSYWRCGESMAAYRQRADIHCCLERVSYSRYVCRL